MSFLVQVKTLVRRCDPPARFDAGYSRLLLAKILMMMSVLILSCSPAISAQGGLQGMTQRAWRIQDGLPDQVIQAIAQTPDHYLWLGTMHGLVRFDGFRFVDYGADVARSLHDFGVYCILVSKDGSLWLGTPGGGVVHLFTGGGRTYDSTMGLQNHLVRALYEDDSGHIWA